MADETIESVQAELAGARARLTEVNQEAKGHRLNADKARQEAEAARADMERITKEFGDKLTVAETARAEALNTARTARKDAALRLAAKDAGMVDLDGLKLLDAESVTVADDGSVTIPDTYFQTAKAAKPWLFGTPNSTSSSSTAPPPKLPVESKPKNARDMTTDEYRVARATLARR
jgi:hypothetical protein